MALKIALLNVAGINEDPFEFGSGALEKADGKILGPDNMNSLENIVKKEFYNSTFNNLSDTAKAIFANLDDEIKRKSGNGDASGNGDPNNFKFYDKINNSKINSKIGDASISELKTRLFSANVRGETSPLNKDNIEAVGETYFKKAIEAMNKNNPEIYKDKTKDDLLIDITTFITNKFINDKKDGIIKKNVKDAYWNAKGAKPGVEDATFDKQPNQADANKFFISGWVFFCAFVIYCIVKYLLRERYTVSDCLKPVDEDPKIDFNWINVNDIVEKEKNLKIKLLQSLMNDNSEYDIVCLNETIPFLDNEINNPLNSAKLYSDNLEGNAVAQSSIFVKSMINTTTSDPSILEVLNPPSNTEYTGYIAESKTIKKGDINVISIHATSTQATHPQKLNALLNALKETNQPILLCIDGNIESKNTKKVLSSEDTPMIIDKKISLYAPSEDADAAVVLGDIDSTGTVTSYKARTYLQPQPDKANLEVKEPRDYIIGINLNYKLDKSSILTHNGRKFIEVGKENGGAMKTPNENFPFDHFVVTATISPSLTGQILAVEKRKNKSFGRKLHGAVGNIGQGIVQRASNFRDHFRDHFRKSPQIAGGVKRKRSSKKRGRVATKKRVNRARVQSKKRKPSTKSRKHKRKRSSKTKKR